MDSTLFAVSVSKKMVKQRDIKVLLSVFRHLDQQPNGGYNRLHLTFGGYGDVPDEVYEIMEIRKWVAFIIERYPKLFFYLTDMQQIDELVMLCYFDVETSHVGEKLTEEEWFKRGRYTPDSRPEVRIKVTWEREKLNQIVAGVRKHGKETGREDLAEKAVDRIKTRTGYLDL